MINESTKRQATLQVRRVIAATGKSFWWIARQIEVSTKTLNRWWTGVTSPTLAQYYMLTELVEERDAGKEHSFPDHGNHKKETKKSANEISFALFLIYFLICWTDMSPSSFKLLNIVFFCDRIGIVKRDKSL